MSFELWVMSFELEPITHNSELGVLTQNSQLLTHNFLIRTPDALKTGLLEAPRQ
jgi:hypothetical protein